MIVMRDCHVTSYTATWRVNSGDYETLKLQSETRRDRDVKIHVVLIAVVQLFFTFTTS